MYTCLYLVSFYIYTKSSTYLYDTLTIYKYHIKKKNKKKNTIFNFDKCIVYFSNMTA